MSGQYSGNGGPQRPSNGGGRPAAAPQQPGPEAIYEVPEDFRDPAGAEGSSWTVGSGGPAGGRGTAAEGQPGTPYGRPEAPIPGMSAKDFEKLCRSIDKAFSQFSRVVGEGIDKAADALGTSPEDNLRAYEELSRKKAEKARKRQLKRNFRSSAGLTVSGVLMTVVGGMGTVSLGLSTLIGLATGAAVGPAGVAAAGVLGVAATAFAVLLGFGIRNLRTASQLKSFQRVFGPREVCTFDELASRTQTSPKKALARARKLLRRGLVPQGRIDDGATCLMVTDSAYRQYRQLQEAQRQTLAEQRAAEAARAAREAEETARERDLADRLTPAERAFVTEGRGYLAQLRRLDEAIDDAAVSERIAAIEEVLGRILARAEEEPAVIAGLDRLTAYYLPTTVKLLEAYDNLEEQPVQGANIATSRQEIERTLTVLHGAFEKLFDDTYQDLSMDVSADITVLHAMLAQEGLVEGPFDVKPPRTP